MAKGTPRSGRPDHLNCPNCNTEVRVGHLTMATHKDCPECGTLIPVKVRAVDEIVTTIEVRPPKFFS